MRKWAITAALWSLPAKRHYSAQPGASEAREPVWQGRLPAGKAGLPVEGVRGDRPGSSLGGALSSAGRIGIMAGHEQDRRHARGDVPRRQGPFRAPGLVAGAGGARDMRGGGSHPEHRKYSSKYSLHDLFRDYIFIGARRH